jgi:hypothetical protein
LDISVNGKLDAGKLMSGQCVGKREGADEIKSLWIRLPTNWSRILGKQWNIVGPPRQNGEDGPNGTHQPLYIINNIILLFYVSPSETFFVFKFQNLASAFFCLFLYLLFYSFTRLCSYFRYALSPFSKVYTI